MCKIHLARNKANKYYWEKLAKAENVTVTDLLFNNENEWPLNNDN